MRTLIDTTVRVVIIALMAMVFCCVVWQVLSRYVVSSPSVLTEELARFGLVWIGALGMGYVTGQKRHLAIDLLSGKLPPSARRALLIFVELATLVFAVLVLTYGGGLLVSKVYMSGQTSPILGLNMGLVYAAIPIAGLLVVYYGIHNLLDALSANAGVSEPGA